MPRLSKMEISAINLRIPAEKQRDYVDLVERLYSQKIAVKVYGNNFVAITDFNAETGIGVFFEVLKN